MAANPVLAKVTRGNWLENQHRGSFCVVNSAGETIAAIGDVERAIFPRSAIKSMQALALFRSGADKLFDLDQRSIALACASHLGEPDHIDGVRETLGKIGCAEADLECGIHPPSSRAARNNLRESGIVPGAIHNNCSGKHAGMLAVARALNVPTIGYSTRDHPVQKLVRSCVEDIMGTEMSTDRCGTDGCSIPTWAAPMRSIALGFSRMANGTELTPGDKDAANSILAAVTNNPFLVGGTDAFDSDVMKIFGARLLSKVGAEGVFCGALPEKGWGYVLKCDDGNMAAAETMVAALLLGIADPDQEQTRFLQQRKQKSVNNWNRHEVGNISATDMATPALN